MTRVLFFSLFVFLRGVLHLRKLYKRFCRCYCCGLKYDMKVNTIFKVE